MRFLDEIAEEVAAERRGAAMAPARRNGGGFLDEIAEEVRRERAVEAAPVPSVLPAPDRPNILTRIATPIARSATGLARSVYDIITSQLGEVPEEGAPPRRGSGVTGTWDPEVTAAEAGVSPSELVAAIPAALPGPPVQPGAAAAVAPPPAIAPVPSQVEVMRQAPGAAVEGIAAPKIPWPDGIGEPIKAPLIPWNATDQEYERHVAENRMAALSGPDDAMTPRRLPQRSTTMGAPPPPPVTEPEQPLEGPSGGLIRHRLPRVPTPSETGAAEAALMAEPLARWEAQRGRPPAIPAPTPEETAAAERALVPPPPEPRAPQDVVELDAVAPVPTDLLPAGSRRRQAVSPAPGEALGAEPPTSTVGMMAPADVPQALVYENYLLSPRVAGQSAAQRQAERRKARLRGEIPSTVAESVGDIMVDAFKTSAVGAGIASGLYSTAGGAMAIVPWVEQLAGVKTGLGDVFKNAAPRIADVAERLTPDDPGWLHTISAGFGSAAAFFIPGMGLGRALQLIGAASPRLALWVGAEAAAIMEAGVEAGAMYQDALNLGLSEQQATSRANHVFWQNLVVLAATNKAGIFAESGGLLRRTVGGVTAEAFQEATQEVIGERQKMSVTENPYAAKDVFSPERLKKYGTAAVVGGAVGGVLGGGRAWLGRRTVAEAKKAAGEDQFALLVAEAERQGLKGEEGELAVARMVLDVREERAATPAEAPVGLPPETTAPAAPPSPPAPPPTPVAVPTFPVGSIVFDAKTGARGRVSTSGEMTIWVRWDKDGPLDGQTTMILRSEAAGALEMAPAAGAAAPAPPVVPAPPVAPAPEVAAEGEVEAPAAPAPPPAKPETPKVEPPVPAPPVAKPPEPPQPPPDTTENPPSAVWGRPTRAETPAGSELAGRWGLAELDDLVVSHSPTGGENETYPQELQRRDRSRVASQDQVLGIANALSPLRLGESALGLHGAPWVAGRVVVGGNGRVNALRLVYGGATENLAKRRDAYRAWLADSAEQFGFTRAQVEAMRRPVLHQQMQNIGPADLSRIAEELNESGIARMSPTEQAMTDAGRLTPEMLSLWAPNEAANPATTENADFRRAFLEHVVGAADRGGFITAKGEPNPAFVQRMRHAIFAKAYGERAVERVADALDDNTRNISAALMNAAPRFVSLRAAAERGDLYPLDPSPDLAEAADTMSYLRDQGMSVETYLNQGDIFNTPLGREFLLFFDRNARSAKRMADILAKYADAWERAGHPQQGGLFGDTIPTAGEVLDAILAAEEGRDVTGPAAQLPTLRQNQARGGGGSAPPPGGKEGGPAPAAGAPGPAGGVTPAPRTVSADAKQAAIDRARGRLGRPTPPPRGVAETTRTYAAGYDPARDADLLVDLFIVGQAEYEAGATDHAAWTERMRGDLGDEVQLHLDYLWKLIGAGRELAQEVPRGKPTEAPVAGEAGGEPPRGGPGGFPDLRRTGGADVSQRRLILARPEQTHRVAIERTPAAVRSALTDEQLQAAEKAIRAMEGAGAFLEADGTGAGKTRVILATASYFAARSHPVVVIAPASVLKLQTVKGQRRVSGSYADDGAAMKVPVSVWWDGPIAPGRIYVTTYEKSKALPQVEDAVLVFDEAHALKNAESARALAGMALARRARAVLFSTATPVDRPLHLDYLIRSGLFGDRTAESVYRSLGMRQRSITVRTKSGASFQKMIWEIDPNVGEETVFRRMRELFDGLTERGGMIKREVDMADMDVTFLPIPLPPGARETAQRIADGLSRGGVPEGLRKAIILMHQRRQQEPYKLPLAALAAKRELDEGRQVVLFVSRVNYSEAVLKQKLYGFGGEVIDEIRHILAASEGSAGTLRRAVEALGITDIAELHGEAEEKASEAMEAFQSGRARVLIATPESGGIGINLDDRTGDRPRTVIMITAPFTATDTVQALGRVNRMTTKSDVRSIFLYSDLPLDAWNLGIVAMKLKALRATVRGGVEQIRPEDTTGVSERRRGRYTAGRGPSQQALPGAETEVGRRGEAAQLPLGEAQAEPRTSGETPGETFRRIEAENRARARELDAKPVGTIMTVPGGQALGSLVGTWERVNVAGDPFWRQIEGIHKGDHKLSAMFAPHLSHQDIRITEPLRTERTTFGDQGLIPGAEKRAIPAGPLKATVRQKDIEDTPLFGQKEEERRRESDKAQGRLFVEERRSAYRAIVGAPAFRRWFGDSKVVDEDGTPKVVYHGTGQPGFETIDPARLDPGALYGPGFYATESPDIAGGVIEMVAGAPKVRHPGYAGKGRPQLDWRARQDVVDDLRRTDEYRRKVAEPGYLSATERVHVDRLLDEWARDGQEYPVDELAGQPYNLVVFRDRVQAARGLGGVYPVYLRIAAPFDIDATTSDETRDRLADGIHRHFGIARETDADTIRAEHDAWLSAKAKEYGIALSEDHPEFYTRLYQSLGPDDRVLWDRYTAIGPFTRGVIALTESGDLAPQAAINALSTLRLRGDLTDTNDVLYDGLRSGLADRYGLGAAITRDILRDAGYDGITHIGGARSGAPPHRVWIAFEPTQVKSATGNVGTFSPEDASLVREPTTPYSALPRPRFYSALRRAVEAKVSTRASADQILATVRAVPGVKAEEIKDTGLEDWLRAQGDRPITRAEVLDYLRANEVRVEIKKLGGGDALRAEIRRRLIEEDSLGFDTVGEALRAVMDPRESLDAWDMSPELRSAIERYRATSQAERQTTRFGPDKSPTLSLPGAPAGTYVELLAKVPEREDLGETLTGEAAGGTPLAEAYVEPHFQEPNVVFHVRGAERLGDQGRRGFLIEELQSQWHLEGRRKGYRGPDAFIEGHDYDWWIREAERLFANPSKRDEWRQAVENRDALARTMHAVPPAPFAKSWHERAFKEALDYALRLPPDAQGRRIEWIGWTPGQVQADRYDLSKQVDNLRVYRAADGYRVFAWVPTRRESLLVAGGATIPEHELERHVGKDVAAKIIAREMIPGGSETLQNIDLKIGGEWAYNLYDRTLPNFVRGYVKKWGARVGEGHIDARDPAVMARADTLLGSIETEQPPQPIHQVIITDAMRRAVLEEGQAAFEPTTRYTRRTDATEADDRGAQQAFDFLDEVARRPVSSLRGTLVRRGQAAVPRTLGVAFDVDRINEELRRTGTVDFRGRVIASPEAYALAAQLLRSPLFETLRFDFTNEAGRVVHQESYTSRLPDSANMFMTRDEAGEAQAMWARAQAHGATKAWVTHNHPTGVPKPSDADVDLTTLLAEYMPLQGHVVTDGKQYGFIEPDGTTSLRDVPGVTEDLLLRPAVPHRLLRRKIENAEDLAALGRELSVPEGWAVAFQVGADQRVRVIQELPIADLVDLDKAVPYLKESRAVSGAVETLLWTTAKDPKLAWNGQFLIRQGAIADYGWTGGTAVVELLGEPGTAAMLEEAAKLRERPGPAIRVEEPTRRYEPLDALDGDLRSIETWVTNAAPRSRIAVGPVVWYRTTNAVFPWRHQAEQISTAGLLGRIQAARAAAQAKTLLPAASNADDATRQNTEAVRLGQARAKADRRAGVPPVPPITPAPATDAAVEAALSTTAVHGLPAVRDRIVEAYHMARRATTFEYDLRGFPLDRDEIRIFHGARRRALWGAKDDVAGVVGRLANLDELRHLGRIVWLRDWLSRSTLVDTLADGSTTPRYPGGLPFGLTPAQVEPELQRLLAAANDRITAAVEAHDRLMEAERVDLEARGLLDEERGIPNYAPHFVLEHQPEPGPRQPGTGQRIREPFRGFLRRTVGSEKAIETNYIRAMFQHRTEVRFADATDDFALTVLQRHDRADRLDPDVRKRLKPGQVVSSLSLVDAQGRPIPGATRYKAIQYRPGRQIFPASSIPERAIAQAIANGEESFEVEVARVRHVGALGRYFRIYVVPEAIANRFEHWGAKETEDGLRLLNNATNRWKALTIGFWGQAGNVLNLLGDVTNLSRTPAALLQLPQAAVEAARWKWGKGTDLTRLMEQYDALSAGYVTGELYFEARMPEFRQFLTHAEQAKQRALDVARTYFRDIPEYREAVPRIAMARHQLRRLAKGKSLQAGPIDIAGLTGVRGAMHLSRRFTVDYQWFTPEENRYLRGFLLPFYSWARQNTPNWLRFLWLSKIGLASFLGLRMMLEMWNNGDDDRRTVEQSLQSYERNSAHLVTGWKDKEGKMIVVFWAGDPVADALGMVGLAGTPARLSDLATERITLSQAAREQLRAFAAEPGQRVANLLTPLVKIPGEIIAGKSTLTGGDITPKSMQGTREDFWRRGRHAAESLIRPLREERQFEIASGKKGFDWLTYRYGLGLPFKRIDVEEAEMRVSTDLWYEARTEAVQEALDDARKSVDFAKLAPHQQEVELRDAADKALKAFEKATKRPVTKKRWRELEYAR